MDAGSWFSTRFAGTRIPSLEEVLQLCRGKIDLNVEIKPSAATPTLEAETVRLLREYGFEGHCVITSQSYETLHKVKELAPDIPTGYILALGVGNYYDLPAADFFSVETTFITSGMVNQIHLRGKTVSAWTIDREEDAKHMMELGADDLITDKPDMVNELLSQNAEMDTTLLSLRDAIQNWFFPRRRSLQLGGGSHRGRHRRPGRVLGCSLSGPLRRMLFPTLPVVQFFSIKNSLLPFYNKRYNRCSVKGAEGIFLISASALCGTAAYRAGSTGRGWPAAADGCPVPESSRGTGR